MSGLSKAFIVGVLKDLGAPPTPSNIAFMTAWANREGGSASWNPWNTTLSAPGASNYNSVGVKNYTSMAEGMQATAQTLSSNLYTDIVGALKAGTANVDTNYKGLHNWSAGPAGAPNKGYWNLSGIPTSGIPAGPSGPTTTTSTPTTTSTSTTVAEPNIDVTFGLPQQPVTAPANMDTSNGALPTDKGVQDSGSTDTLPTDQTTGDLLWANFQANQTAVQAQQMTSMPAAPDTSQLLFNNFQGAQ